MPRGGGEMSWYLIEMPDGAPTPYVTETDSGMVYGLSLIHI